MKLGLGLRSTWPDLAARPSYFLVLRSLRAAPWLLCRLQVGDPPWSCTARRSEPHRKAGKLQELSAVLSGHLGNPALASTHSTGHVRWNGVSISASTGPLNQAVAQSAKTSRRIAMTNLLKFLLLA